MDTLKSTQKTTHPLLHTPEMIIHLLMWRTLRVYPFVWCASVFCRMLAWCLSSRVLSLALCNSIVIIINTCAPAGLSTSTHQQLDYKLQAYACMHGCFSLCAHRQVCAHVGVQSFVHSSVCPSISRQQQCRIVVCVYFYCPSRLKRTRARPCILVALTELMIRANKQIVLLVFWYINIFHMRTQTHISNWNPFVCALLCRMHLCMRFHCCFVKCLYYSYGTQCAWQTQRMPGITKWGFVAME